MIIFSESKNTDLTLCRICTVSMVSIERTEPTGQTGQTEQVPPEMQVNHPGTT